MMVHDSCTLHIGLNAERLMKQLHTTRVLLSYFGDRETTNRRCDMCGNDASWQVLSV